MIIFITHIDIEGPALLKSYFEKQGFKTKTLALHEGDCLPRTFNDIDAVIVLGGPMNVYQEDEYAFLSDENRFIKDVLRRKIPYLGICLGSQLLAKACGAKVSRAPVKEIGWSKVHLTLEGQKDPLFSEVESRINVFQWHEDTFDIPNQGVLLSTSLGCAHQAFRVDSCAYGLQFHIEVQDKDIALWVERYFNVSKVEQSLHGKEMFQAYQDVRLMYLAQAEKICSNFARVIRKHSRVQPAV